MRIAAVHGPQGKIYGAIQDENFRPFSIGGASVRDLRHVIKLLGEGERGAGNMGEPVPLARAQTRPRRVGPLTKERDLCGAKIITTTPRNSPAAASISPATNKNPRADPVIFTKSTSSLADPFQKISASADPTRTVDYEGEFGRGDRPPRQEHQARRCARLRLRLHHRQRRHRARPCSSATSSGFLGKSLDGFCPVGAVAGDARRVRRASRAGSSPLSSTASAGSSPSWRDMIFDVPTFIETVHRLCHA